MRIYVESEKIQVDLCRFININEIEVDLTRFKYRFSKILVDRRWTEIKGFRNDLGIYKSDLRHSVHLTQVVDSPSASEALSKYSMLHYHRVECDTIIIQLILR